MNQDGKTHTHDEKKHSNETKSRVSNHVQMHHQPEDKDNTKFGITKYSDFPNRYVKSQSPFDDFYRDSKF